ncbi:MAG: SpoIIE family protein phosphatase [Chloroflexi bacterium]|nr:SpoIIE family protein phosphatase [Chloroflexota bacterium]
MTRIVEVASHNLSKRGEELCGDFVKVITTPDSLVVVLSDGLGSGVKANIMSTLTAHVAASMFQQGAAVEDVMETLVQTLPECQVRKLAYATFSMLKIDRARQAYLVEYDNPPLILVRGGEVVDLPVTETEVNGRKIKEARFTLCQGDYMVMVSDGYIHAGVGGLYRFGWGWKNLSTAVRRLVQTGCDTHELTRALSRTCLKLYGGEPGDDATVVGMLVRSAVQATIWTGPPADPAQDDAAVQRLMSAEGTKVICGGTTAQIAARVLGQELKVEWVPPSKRQGGSAKRKRTPPTAKLQGVDLVTEGILTLAQTVERLEEVETSHDLPHDDDAATRLARIILTSDRIRLLVGTAINPNQVADLIRGEPMRMVYVKQLIQQLERLGKEYTLERI